MCTFLQYISFQKLWCISDAICFRCHVANLKMQFFGEFFESCPNIFFEGCPEISFSFLHFLKFYLTLWELLCLAQVGSSIMDELINATFSPFLGSSNSAKGMQFYCKVWHCMPIVLFLSSVDVYTSIFVCEGSCYATLEEVALDGWRIWDIQSPLFSFFLASASSYSFPWWKLNEAGPRRLLQLSSFLVGNVCFFCCCSPSSI